MSSGLFFAELLAPITPFFGNYFLSRCVTYPFCHIISIVDPVGEWPCRRQPVPNIHDANVKSCRQDAAVQVTTLQVSKQESACVEIHKNRAIGAGSGGYVAPHWDVEAIACRHSKRGYNYGVLWNVTGRLSYRDLGLNRAKNAFALHNTDTIKVTELRKGLDKLASAGS